VIDRLDGHCRRFIELSPFCVLSTVGSDGGPDLSPRGGEPGFVRVPDEHTVVLPDRPGNYRLDNLANAAVRPAVALLFMVPGIEETLRVYGQAEVVTLDHARRLALGVDSKGRTELRITVTRAFFHCAKAIMRSRLWDPATQVGGICSLPSERSSGTTPASWARWSRKMTCAAATNRTCKPSGTGQRDNRWACLPYGR
jgi:uncharacterized protein